MCNFLSGVVTIEKYPRVLCANLLHHEKTIELLKLTPETYREWEWTADDEGESLKVRHIAGENPNVLKSAILAKFNSRNECLTDCIRQLVLASNKSHMLDISNTPVTAIPDAPNATTLYARYCRSLTKINAPNATTLYASCCDLLTNIDAPNATTLDARYCRSLTKINAPNATTLDASGCRSLTKINAPNATTLYASYCRSLTKIDAPNATTLDASGCRSLTEKKAIQ
jgi:hypothetical protein